MQRLWFKAKRYGWGWYPVTWQGAAVTLAYVASLVAASLSLLSDQEPSWEAVVGYFIVVAVLTGFLLVICWKTGERPRWRWGS
ncbi:MAG: hypothetical protein HY369_05390 [Candidatus Aenigmarchaeota archaeon]|nr:hypothetical protein [Candidatus Aenigmarchaeota archaeon]